MKPPKLAYLLKKFPRTSETFVLNEILGQEELGLDVHVFSRRPPDDEPRHPQLAQLRAQVEELPGQRGLAPWLALFEHAAGDPRLIERLGALIRELAGFQHDRMHSLFAEALYLLRRTRELGIEHVHVHFATDSAIAAMILQDLGGPGYSLTAHAKDIYRSTVDVGLLARVVERSRFTVTVCDANVRFLAERLPARALARLRRLYNGVDLEDFSLSRARRTRDHVLAVGRLVPKKGFDVLVDALGILRDRGVPFRATIMGDGEERPALERRIAELRLGASIELTGAVGQNVVRQAMKRAGVFALPCVVGRDGNRDALPTVLLEAIAVGLPCISTPVTGVPEILGEGRCGRLVPERDATATADALQELLGDADERARISAAGRARAEELFDARANARTLMSWFCAAQEALQCA